ncbi:hypothetical protein SAMN05421595_0506 [Austwickia chelonae]|uniref:SIMPL domain-containing protein n=1 Tax=Austwickia chelonae NBRC 105200 TaxID=1184607 RepID=K6W865_9MICO|nr:SIMPL domain-containing protein [Austwickia chelonae]GAB77992.1 hypothetical protein AUCHE_08_02350 [Austwickia chelonae NBRC 105200]SEV93844.1 hypothetical protein SAMN05421595_0506 [Austwickia chelonae]
MDITVVGHKRTSLPPERATLHLTVSFESGDRTESLNRATASVHEVSACIRDLEGSGVSPVTWHAVLPITTRSWRPYSDARALLPMRYAATAVVKVKFRDFQVLTRFAHQVGTIAGVTLHDVEWSLTEINRRQVTGWVLGQAVEEARERALVVARAAGADDVEAVEIADQGLLSGVNSTAGEAFQGGELRDAALALTTGGENGIDIMPEDVSVEATVHARFTTLRAGSG